MARARLVLLGVLAACRAAPSGGSPDAGTDVAVATPSAVASVVDEPPIVYPTFDAGGRTEIEIPTVRCDDAGQTGWMKVFPRATWKMKVTKELLALDDPPSQLRAYVSPQYVVLGPPGFRCAGWYGSSGAWLSVVPADAMTYRDRVPRAADDDEAIRVQELFWSTSGRFRAASVSARVFPTLRKRAREVYVAWRGIGFDGFTVEPYPGETIEVSGLHASWIDPPGVAAIGAAAAELATNDDAIHGSTIHWERDEFGSMLTVAVRLRAEREPLIAAILADFDLRMRDCRGPGDCFGVRDLPRCHDGGENPCP